VVIIIFLLIEFLDEFAFGVTDAALPIIKNDLHLSYIQIGLVLSIPGMISNLVEPFLGLLGDIWRRRILILSGGIMFAAACVLTALSHNFVYLLVSFIVMNPSSGAFVSLSQASLMDTDASRHEHNMARWTFAGSLGVVLGPIILGAAAIIGLSWRPLFVLIAGITLFLVFIAWRNKRFAIRGGKSHVELKSIIQGFQNAFAVLKKWVVLRWLILLEFSDLMLDVLYGFLALYFVDVIGISVSGAAMAVAVWTGFGLLGDLLIIPLLEKVRGLRYLRISVVLELILYPAFLIIPFFWGKLVLLGLLGLFNSGWYAILKGNLYSALPGQSGIVMSLTSIAGLFGKLIPFGIGMAAERLGLGSAMWILILGPVVLLFGLPRLKVLTEVRSS
jgi:MFS transporter, FSR family, fosmidomycin resistance protein